MRIWNVSRGYHGVGPATGGTPIMIQNMTRALLKKGQQVTVVMPLPATLPLLNNHVDPVYIPLAGNQIEIKARRAKFENPSLPEFYFLEMPKTRLIKPILFDAPMVEKYMGLFFDRAAVELLKRIGGQSDLAHVHTKNDFFPYFAKAEGLKMPIAYTLHNLEGGMEQCFSPQDFRELTGYDHDSNEMVNPRVLAMQNSDTTVVPSKAYERILRSGRTIHTEYQPVIDQLGERLVGIPSGLDEEFSPEHLFREGAIPHLYGPNDLTGKAANKRALQRGLDLAENPEALMVLYSQPLEKNNGIEEFSAILNYVTTLTIQVVIMGAGAPEVESLFRYHEGRHHDKIRFIRFDKDVAAYEPWLLAGADIVNISAIEKPVGTLAFMGQRMGALPLVNPNGGLSEIVEDKVNGFVINPEGNLRANLAQRFLEVYQYRRSDAGGWAAMQRNAMENVPTWDEPAALYLELYRQLTAQK